MVKIASFYKKEDENNDNNLKKPAEPPKAPPPQSVKKERPEIIPEKQQETAEEVYNETIKFFKSFHGKLSAQPDFFDHKLFDIVERLIKHSTAEKTNLFFFTEKTSMDNSLYTHSVNTAIFSIALGSKAGFSPLELQIVGLSALLHHVGLFGIMGLVQNEMDAYLLYFKAVKNQEQVPHKAQEIKASLREHLSSFMHKLFSSEKIKHTGQAYQGKNYEKQVEKYAHIILFSSLYELLTHKEQDEQRLLPHEVCKWIIENWQKSDEDNVFIRELTRAFIDTIGLFPLGSYVLLSTDEIARIIRVEHGSPVRPIVDVLLSPQGERIKEKRIISLKDMPLIYIKAAVDESKLRIKDKKFMLSLKIRRWWTDR